MSDHRRTIASIYQAFGRRDVPAILAAMSPEVRWQPWADNSAQRAGVPYMLEQHGLDGVKVFFSAVAASLQVNSMQVLDLAASERMVVAELAVDYTVRATGARLQDQMLHLWGFDEAGRVDRYQNFLDTAKHIRANRLLLAVE
jgi:ketosteroid isomerase-like protein